MDIKIRQAAAVRMEFVQGFERTCVAHDNLSIRSASAYNTRPGRAVCKRWRCWAFYQNTVFLLVGYAQLPENSEPLDVKVVDLIGETTQEETLLLVEKHTLQILKWDLVNTSKLVL